MNKALYRFELSAQTIIQVSSLLEEHIEVRRDLEKKAKELDSRPTDIEMVTKGLLEERAKLAVIKDRTQGAVSALGAVIFTLYEGMGEDIKSLLSGAE